MNKIFKEIKSVKKQISDAKKEITNVQNWPDATCRPGEKKLHIENLNHWIGELKESLLKLLDKLEWEIQVERNTLQNDNTPISKSA